MSVRDRVDFVPSSEGSPVRSKLMKPERMAEAAARLGLKHVVITSVTRDDLLDGGADHYVKCIEAVRERTGATVEVLTPDFVNSRLSLDLVAQAKPDVFNHNTETVPRLYRRVRGPKSDYNWTLRLLQRVKEVEPGVKTKSGLMLGLGETQEEILDVLADLRQSRLRFPDAWGSTCNLRPIATYPSFATFRLKNLMSSVSLLRPWDSRKSLVVLSFAVVTTREKWQKLMCLNGKLFGLGCGP